MLQSVKARAIFFFFHTNRLVLSYLYVNRTGHLAMTCLTYIFFSHCASFFVVKYLSCCV